MNIRFYSVPLNDENTIRFVVNPGDVEVYWHINTPKTDHADNVGRMERPALDCAIAVCQNLYSDIRAKRIRERPYLFCFGDNRATYPEFTFRPDDGSWSLESISSHSCNVAYGLGEEHIGALIDALVAAMAQLEAVGGSS